MIRLRLAVPRGLTVPAALNVLSSLLLLGLVLALSGPEIDLAECTQVGILLDPDRVGPVDPDGNLSYLNATLAGWLDYDLAQVGSGGLKLSDIVVGDGAALLTPIPGEPGDVKTEVHDLDLCFDDADWINHYPENRHVGVFGVQFCDGHVLMLRKTEFTPAMYYVR